MTFKIGDEVSILDGSYSVLLKTDIYNTWGVNGNNKITGHIVATDCRLPIGPSSTGERPTPREGMSSSYFGKIFNDLLVKTDTGFVCTSSDLVTPAVPEYKLIICGVEIDITPEQNDTLEALGFFDGWGERLRVLVKTK